MSGDWFSGFFWGIASATVTRLIIDIVWKEWKRG
jgi:hypothetical protein